MNMSFTELGKWLEITSDILKEGVAEIAKIYELAVEIAGKVNSKL